MRPTCRRADVASSGKRSGRMQVSSTHEHVTDNEADIRRLLDEASIRRLLASYCRAVDRGDLTTLRSLYHPDARDDHTGVYSGSVDGFIATQKRSLDRGEVSCPRHCV